MNKQEKLAFIRRFSEDKLRKDVLIPLFNRMVFKDVIEYHGQGEKGKDIIFCELDSLGDKVYTGVAVKKENITGSVSKPGGAMIVLNQIQQTFNEPYTDIYGLKKLKIDRCWVVTSGRIESTSIDSFAGSLEKSNLDKLVKFIDGNKLVDLLNEKMPGIFWDEYDFFNKYFAAMKADFETIHDVSAIGQKQGIPLDDIYISLKLRDKREERELSFDEQGKIFDEKFLEQETEWKMRQRIHAMRVRDTDTALRNHRRLVVLGAPGAGKTTLLKHLALKLCKQNLQACVQEKVPIPVTLREFGHSEKSLRDYIDDVFTKYKFPQARDFVEKDLQEGKALLLLDGFDELASPENQRKVTLEIRHFLEQYPMCPMVVSSRIAGYHDDLTDFTSLELMEFDDSQLKQFIDNWFGSADPGKAAAMAKAVKENKNIDKLARNPLLAAIIAIIYEEDKDLPQRRAQLYERMVQVLLSKWDVQKSLKNKYPADKKEFILSKLAYDCHCRNQRTMSQEMARELFCRYAGQVKLDEGDFEPFLKEIFERSFLVREIAQGHYDFLHLSFQEYFTAQELIRQADGIGTIIQNLDKPWWQEPALLYVGIKQDAGPSIERLQKEAEEDIFYSNLMFAGRCIADAEFTVPHIKDEIIRKLWALYQEGEFESLREKAGEVLSLLKPQQIITDLLCQFQDKDNKVRKNAVEALGVIGGAQVLTDLTQALQKDPDDDVRCSAAEALGVIGGAQVLTALILAMQNDTDSSVRISAAAALGDIGGASALTALTQATQNDPDNLVRVSAAAALRIAGDADGLALPTQSMQNDTDKDVRVSVAEALGTASSAQVLTVLTQATQNDPDKFVRFRAAYALGTASGEDALPIFIQALKKNNHSLVRISAAQALGKIGGAQALPALTQAIQNDPDSGVRGSAAFALGKIGDETAILPLQQALTDEGENIFMEERVKDAAYESLEKISRRLGIRITPEGKF